MQVPYYIDLLGTFVFALSGALAAYGKLLYRDLFGISFTAFITAIGGGTLRDITLGVHPLAWVADGNYLIVIFLGVLTAVSFRKTLLQLRKTLFLFDSIGIGLYTILGVQKSLSFGVHPLAAIILGMFSAVFGGVIRDTLVNEIPLIFRKEIYATACLAGAIVFVVMNRFGISANISSITGILVIIAIRIVSVQYRISLPRIED